MIIFDDRQTALASTSRNQHIYGRVFRPTSVLCTAQWQFCAVIADGLVPASPLLHSFEVTRAQQFTEKEAKETLNGLIDEAEQPQSKATALEASDNNTF